MVVTLRRRDWGSWITGTDTCGCCEGGGRERGEGERERERERESERERERERERGGARVEKGD